MAFFRSTRTFLDAADAGNMTVLKDYLANSPEDWCTTREKATGDTALHKAAAHGRLGAITLLLEKSPAAAKAWTNELGETPLSLAVANGQSDAVRLLLADPAAASPATVTGGLKAAIIHDRTDLLQALVATGKADLATDMPALYRAVSNGRADCVTILLSLGANPNVTRTVQEHSGTESAYLTRYAGRRRPDQRAESPLFKAVRAGHPLMVRELLAAGACVTARELPLHAAAAEGRVKMAEELLAARIVPLNGELPAPPAPGGAVLARMPDINAFNGAGQTALHLAVAGNQADMVKFLLEHGANAGLADSERRTPLSIAQQFGRKDMILLLGGNIPVKPVPQALPAEPAINAAPTESGSPRAMVAEDIMPPVLPPAPAAAAPEVEKITSAPVTGDTWTREGHNRVVHVEDYPAQNRRLTEIFNFETRERAIFSENLSLKTETMGPRENFDAVTEEALAKALAEFRRLGGAADEGQVFRNRLGKLKAGPG